MESTTDGTIELVEHDPSWAERYVVEQARLMTVLGDVALAVEHVGSTSVPGMPSKPTIDIAVVVADLAVVEERRPQLAALGYDVRGGLHGRHRFARLVRDGKRVVHLHVLEAGCTDWDDWIGFREWLRATPAAAAAYAAKKRELLASCGGVRAAYVDAKGEYVSAMMPEVRRWWSGRRLGVE